MEGQIKNWHEICQIIKNNDESKPWLKLLSPDTLKRYRSLMKRRKKPEEVDKRLT